MTGPEEGGNGHLAGIEQDALPRHVAIIMDGNGRWATSQGSLRTKGHERGAKTVRAITTECASLGIEQLTLYAFSLENWKRPRAEIAFLMNLLKRFLVQERPILMENNVRLTAIGRLDELPAGVRQELDQSVEMSSANTGLNLCLALAYGGRAEIVDACRTIAERVREGALEPNAMSEEVIAEHLYQPGCDPDLLIRTAGESRISNFLLWQISYAEIYITTKCWPEFSVDEFHRALRAFAGRTRKFGGLVDPVTPPSGG
ncbi:MAG: polyprenyl diphosphate synthase [Planctomycetota bacterium]|nr:polyprenyl diphosphate synthase [Planctomycetota bacterium]